MLSAKSAQPQLEEKAREFYQKAMRVLKKSGVPFLVGGAYAFEHYTGVSRHTKDFDVFVRASDCRQVLDVFAQAGYKTEMTFPYWLGKAYCGENFIDVIFSSANGIARVDDSWFRNDEEVEIFGIPLRFCQPEEIIWSKAFVMERERYDGADIAHLIRCYGDRMDWRLLIDHFGDHWRVLLSHLILYGFIYPSERDKVPGRVIQELLGRLQREMSQPAPAEKVCYGTELNRQQYLVDVGEWGYRDARLEPLGQMRAKDIAHWTAAIEQEENK